MKRQIRKLILMTSVLTMFISSGNTGYAQTISISYDKKEETNNLNWITSNSLFQIEDPNETLPPATDSPVLTEVPTSSPAPSESPQSTQLPKKESESEFPDEKEKNEIENGESDESQDENKDEAKTESGQPTPSPSITPNPPQNQQEQILSQEIYDETTIIQKDTGIFLSSLDHLNVLNETEFRQAKAQHQLIKDHRVAKWYAGQGLNGYEFATKFTLDGKPVFCIEPYTMVIFNGNQGPIYTPSNEFKDYTLQQQIELCRILWYGYGHPLTGTDDEAWLATQVLLWQITDPAHIDEIVSTLEMCTDSACTAVTGQTVDLSAKMNQILNLVHNRDTAPSFADQWHQTRTYELDWEETLILTDDGSSNLFQGTPVLEWFEAEPNESHQGINIKKQGNSLFVDIDSLYYDGYDTPNGKTLTFDRVPALFENAIQNNLVWISGDNQKIMSVSGSDPTPSYTLAFKLKTADIVIDKKDEYGQSNNFTAGTQFILGWAVDEENQYRHDGGQDEIWKEIHDWNTDTQTDELGEFGIVNGKKKYFPILDSTHQEIRKFTVGADGVARIENFLPQNKKWWIKEVATTDAYLLDQRVFSANTGQQHSLTKIDFVNDLKDVTLELFKQDEETLKHLNGARYQLFELDDLDKGTTENGIESSLGQSAPKLSYRQIERKIDEMKVGHHFIDNGFLYTLVEESADAFQVSVTKLDAPSDSLSINRYDLDGIKENETFSFQQRQKPHATLNENDDTITETEVQLLEKNQFYAVVKSTDIEHLKSFSLDELPEDIDTSNLKVHQQIEINGNLMTIQKIEAKRILVSEDTLITVDLNDPTPRYWQIPHVRTLKVDDEFELGQGIMKTHFTVLQHDGEHLRLNASYLRMQQLSFNQIQDDDLCQENHQEIHDFSLLKKGQALLYQGQKAILEEIDVDAQQLILRIETRQEIECVVPPWIDYDDVPEQIKDTAELSIRQIIHPVYTVKRQEDGTLFEISDNAVYQLKGEDKVLIQDSSIPDYLTLIQAGDLLQGSACGAPFDITGCPIGTVRDYPTFETSKADYQGIQYDEIQPLLDELQNGKTTESLKVNDTFDKYTVVVPVNPSISPASLTLSFSDEQQNEIQVTLIQGQSVSEAVLYRQIKHHYEIIDRTEKELILTYHNAKIGTDHLIEEKDFKLRPYTDKNNRLDLSYEKIENCSALRKGQTFTLSNQTYTVLFHDEIEKLMVVEDSEQQWYKLTEDDVMYFAPITYEEIIRQEQQRQRAFAVNEKLSHPISREILQQETFEIENIPYTLTLKRNGLFHTVTFPWQFSAPYSWNELLEKTKNGMSFEENGKTYTLQLIEKTGTYQAHYQLSDGTARWDYHTFQLMNQQPNLPYEQTHLTFYFDIMKPNEITLEDFRAIFSDGQEKVGDEFEFRHQTYKIVRLTNEWIQLENRTTHKKIKLDLMQEQHQFITFLPIGEKIKLTELFPLYDEATMEIRFSNSQHHGILEEQYLCLLKPTSLILELCDKTDGSLLERKEIFSSNRYQGEQEVLKVFQGETGKQYFRLVYDKNHNRPFAYTTVDLYSDEALSHKVTSLTSDGTGTVDVSSLESGKYYYANPLSQEIKEVLVRPNREVEGMLSIEQLKWGRTYLACEVNLPKGYEITDEVCTPFTMTGSQHHTKIIQTLSNRLRKLLLQVVKVDEDRPELLLNGAWFTVKDVTGKNNQNEDSSHPQLVTMKDLDPQLEIGDLVYIWREKENGAEKEYTLVKIRDDEVVVQDTQGKNYFIPKIGIHENIPFLFQDLIIALSGRPLNEGFTFKIKEKQPFEALRTYQVVACRKDEIEFNGEHFHQLQEVTLIDMQDTSQTPITIKAGTAPSETQDKYLGTFVSGQLLVEQLQTKSTAPILWKDLLHLIQSEKLQEKDSISLDMEIPVRLPSYQEITEMNLLRFPTQIEWENQTWTVHSWDESKTVVEIDGQRFTLTKDTVIGDVVIQRPQTFTLHQFHTDSSNHLRAVTLLAENGQSFYIHEGEPDLITGKAGIKVQVLQENQEIANGYTNRNGHCLFNNLKDGTYTVLIEGEKPQIKTVTQGQFEIDNIPYGHQLEICEIKSPLGYIVGNACSILTPTAEITQSTVKNIRPNKKIIWWQEGKRRVRIRKMGVA